ncbi:2-oxo-4-hydroxy-4-carboxy-5-ureidoimidazoline decarboxylase [Marinomonas agarivorans]|nr:2-oxo-4-hydroxy-4-carboxy-5-ureidoimidazoline decarboxylase [Marinomonas agarivorans]
MTLDDVNNMTPANAYDWFEQTCAAKRWCHAMAEGRPYTNKEQLQQQAQNIWQTMQQEDVLQALAAHPMIGDITTLREKYANTKALAAGEQSGVTHASDDVLQRLSQLNQAYVAKHGFIFIICASGLSASQMLAELEQRLPNSTAQELTIAGAEQIKITQLRLHKALIKQRPN